jgi:beta-lactamase class D
MSQYKIAKGMVMTIQPYFLCRILSRIKLPDFALIALSCALSYSLSYAMPVHAELLCNIIADAKTGQIIEQQGDSCSERVTPASTTKIPLAVMGFDSGFLKTPHAPTFPFREGYVDWLGDIWKQPTDPTRWLKYSVVWYSQLITHELGQRRVEKYAADFGFGNADFSGDPGQNNGLDRAWISSSLKVSPHEQMAFLGKLVNRTLPVAADVFDKVYQSVDTWPAAGGWTIHGKTGMAFPKKPDGSLNIDKAWGWFVGWAEKDGRTLLFTRLLQNKTKEQGSASFRARDEVLQQFSTVSELFSPHKTIVQDVVYKGKSAVLVEEPANLINVEEDKLAILDNVIFDDGEIEVWVAGDRRQDAFEQARGFVGIAFRISQDRSKFEAIYLRPTNGRAEDQLRRNHSIQYISFPEYPWHQLRAKNPGKYESYADMAPGEWIKYRLVVKGTKAHLYLNDSEQPSLIVNDLKLGQTPGSVGLWIGPGTRAYFSGLTVSN